MTLHFFNSFKPQIIAVLRMPLLVAIPLLITACSQNPGDRARDTLLNGDCSTALAAFSSLAESNSDSYLFLAGQGLSAHCLHSRPLAEDSIAKAISLNKAEAPNYILNMAAAMVSDPARFPLSGAEQMNFVADLLAWTKTANTELKKELVDSFVRNLPLDEFIKAFESNFAKGGFDAILDPSNWEPNLQAVVGIGRPANAVFEAIYSERLYRNAGSNSSSEFNITQDERLALLLIAVLFETDGADAPPRRVLIDRTSELRALLGEPKPQMPELSTFSAVAVQFFRNGLVFYGNSLAYLEWLEHFVIQWPYHLDRAGIYEVSQIIKEYRLVSGGLYESELHARLFPVAFSSLEDAYQKGKQKLIPSLEDLLYQIGIPDGFFEETRRNVAAHLKQSIPRNLERCFTMGSSYSGCDLTGIQDVDNYDIDVQIADDGMQYSVSASPNGLMSSLDRECGTFRINHRGRKTISGSGTKGVCW